jgi:type I site-specific restriction endonuclease
MNEAETRADLIDPLLAAAGWDVVERLTSTAAAGSTPCSPASLSAGSEDHPQREPPCCALSAN